VLEFKTGRASPEHETQLAIYRRAAEALFSGAIVDARLVYLNEPDPAAGESDLKAVESKQTHA
jgi:hypothetical protein